MKQVIEGLEKGLNAIAEAVQGGATPVPTPTTADRGKFLGVNASNNNIGWKEIDVDALPEQSESTDGMFLRSEYDGISGESEAAWASIKQVPSAVAASAGDVLTADGEGSYDWASPSGGGLQVVVAQTEAEYIESPEHLNVNAVSVVGQASTLANGTYLMHFYMDPNECLTDSYLGYFEYFTLNIHSIIPLTSAATIYPVSAGIYVSPTASDFTRDVIPVMPNKSRSVDENALNYYFNVSGIQSLASNWVAEITCIVDVHSRS